ncbi:MAG: hypothetical protein H0V44_15990 [Planctomycetes bacterium]|nr:hypothetical protein [Planctomycetota bacterium]
MRYALALIVVCSLGAGMGCGERPAPPPPAPPAKPMSSWTESDSQAAAKELITDATRNPWVAEYRTRMNRMPRVAVGEIVDRSGDNVDVTAFTTDLEHALSSSLQVGVVRSPTDADLILTGAVSRESGKNASYFQVDLRLSATDGGDTVWQRGIERQIDTPAK